MRAGWVGQSFSFAAGALVALVAVSDTAEARHRHSGHGSHSSAALHSGFSQAYESYSTRSWRPHWQRSALQCVPFARENTGIELSGNAGTWWNNATGLYERGARPEVGSVLNFRATGHMRMGHVAVVTNVLSGRHIEIDHANWGAPGRVSRNIDVVDVSPGNDWTAVRVALGQGEDYGSTYPTFGFIYDRPDRGTMVANNAPIAAPVLNPVPSDFRETNERIATQTVATAPEEVAEAVDDDESAPRYSSHHRSQRVGKNYPTKSFSLHSFAANGSSHHHGYSPFPTATTYHVSAHGSSLSVVKPHKGSHRRL